MTHATLCELMRQHELDFTAPADRAPAARPLARPRLLILACSSSKAEGEDLSARDRYTGDLPPRKWTGLSRSAFGLGGADIAQ